jgi:hypothetical protein
MSGPFTQTELERILRGFFYSSALIMAKQEQGPGINPKFRICQNLSKGGRGSDFGSVNSFIDKGDFKTRFDTAFRVAEAVRPFP